MIMPFRNGFTTAYFFTLIHFTTTSQCILCMKRCKHQQRKEILFHSHRRSPASLHSMQCSQTVYIICPIFLLPRRISNSCSRYILDNERIKKRKEKSNQEKGESKKKRFMIQESHERKKNKEKIFAHHLLFFCRLVLFMTCSTGT